MSVAEMCERMNECARNYLARGITPDEVDAWADEEATNGANVSADFTRCVAGIMRHLIESNRNFPFSGSF